LTLTDLSLSNNYLAAMEAFPLLAAISGSFLINGNLEISDLTGLAGVTEIGALKVFDNATITSLDILPAFTTLGKSLFIEENQSLSDITRLLGIVSYTGSHFYVSISDNPSLATCAAEEVVAHFVNDLGADPTEFTVEGNNDSLTCE
jgi:hypothetical protein